MDLDKKHRSSRVFTEQSEVNVSRGANGIKIKTCVYRSYPFRRRQGYGGHAICPVHPECRRRRCIEGSGRSALSQILVYLVLRVALKFEMSTEPST